MNEQAASTFSEDLGRVEAQVPCEGRFYASIPVLGVLLAALLPVLLASGSGPPASGAQPFGAERSAAPRELSAQDRRRASSLEADGEEEGGRIRGFVEATGRWLRPAGRVVPVREGALWVARCIYAETNRPREQRLVAWVVRNRVETRFRGQSTYEDIVLDPGQFTPFNGPGWSGGRYRAYYLWLHPAAEAPGWKEALRIAVSVTEAPPARRPFPVETRHFFSEVSMPEGRWPRWAEGRTPARVQRGAQPDPRRFRFFEGIPARAPAQQ